MECSVRCQQADAGKCASESADLSYIEVADTLDDGSADRQTRERKQQTRYCESEMGRLRTALRER